jgi:RNA polymerase sigma-70 factor (ECF subfamily)
MLRVQCDDDGAFARLLDRYWSQIYGRCFRQLGDRQEAEDLAQEVFMRLFRHRKRYQPQARFATWLFHITQNVVRNAFRTRRRHPLLPLDMRVRRDAQQDHPVEDFLFDRHDTPSQPIERAELAGKVRAAVADLRGRQRTALELHQFQDWTYAEIAAEMQMTPKAAKSLLYRARNQLRANLVPMVQNEQ